MDVAERIPLVALGAAAMDVQRGSLDVFARNVAAAQVGGDYGFTRYEPVVGLDERGLPTLDAPRAEHVANGSVVSEMMAMMQAQRSYESDASIFAIGKHIAEQTIAIERA